MQMTREKQSFSKFRYIYRVKTVSVSDNFDVSAIKQFVILRDRSTSICAVRFSISNASVSDSNPSVSSIQSATSEPRKRQDRFDKPPSDLGTDKPKQPKIKFPVDSIKRKFNAQWYEKYEWLEYSKERDAAFCFACREQGDVALTENTKRFAIYSFYNWKKALGGRIEVCFNTIYQLFM